MTNKKFKKIDVNLSTDEFIMLAKEAHKRDITLNQYCNILLEKYIDEFNKKGLINGKPRRNKKSN